GIDVVTVQTLLGHSNLKTTARYRHSSTRRSQQMPDLLDRLLLPTPTAVPAPTPTGEVPSGVPPALSGRHWKWRMLYGNTAKPSWPSTAVGRTTRRGRRCATLPPAAPPRWAGTASRAPTADTERSPTNRPANAPCPQLRPPAR